MNRHKLLNLLTGLTLMFTMISCGSQNRFEGEWVYQDSGIRDGDNISWQVEPFVTGFSFYITGDGIISRSKTDTLTDKYRLVADSILIVEREPRAVDTLTIVQKDEQFLVLKMSNYPSLIRFKRKE